MSGRGELAWTVYEILAPFLTALLAWVSMKVAAWIRAKTQNEYVAGTLLRLNDSAFTAVKAIEQTLVRELKAAKTPASAGGVRLTAEEAEQVKQAALAEVRSYWGPKGVRELATILGLNDEALQRVLSSKLEAAVHDVRRLNGAHP